MCPSAITSSDTLEKSDFESPVVTDTTDIKDINRRTLQKSVPSNLQVKQDPSRQREHAIHTVQEDVCSLPQSRPLYPRLACQVNLHHDQLILTQDGREVRLQISPESAIAVQTLCTLMNGHHSLSQLQQRCTPDHPETVSALVHNLAQQGFIRTDGPKLLETEVLETEGNIASTLHGAMNHWLYKGLSEQALKPNGFWKDHPQNDDILLDSQVSGQENKQENWSLRPILTPELLKGWGIESYQLFSQLQGACASLLSYVGTRQTQSSINALYAALQDYVQHLMVVLETIGVDEEAMEQTLPLSSTMTVVNGLTFWSTTEPLFCLSSLGFVLDRMVTNVEDYVAAIDRLRLVPQPPNGLSPDSWLMSEVLVVAMRSLIHDQRSHSPLSLTHGIFDDVHIDPNAKARFYNQSHLLVDILCHFYDGIGLHYGPNSGSISESNESERLPLDILRNPVGKLGFKDGVLLTFKDTKIELRYQAQGFAIAVSDDGQESLKYALRLLQMGGVSPEALSNDCPDLQESLPDILAECDRQGLLQRNQLLADRLNICSGCSGTQFYQDLLRFMTWLKQQFPPSPLSQHMTDGTISQVQLIGYALESYHVTVLCPRLLAPALAHPESPKTQALLRDFFVSELHHDRLMEKSLRSVGFSTAQLQHMQPLATTFSVCSSLGIFARQHPLSFKAALMLFEEDDPHFHSLFEHCCRALDLPPEFYQPILLHARINDEGEHDKITADLLSEIPYIAPIDQLIVKKI